MKAIVNILVIESGKGNEIINEMVDFLFSRTQCEVTHLTSFPQVLKFCGIEIHINEQTVYRDNHPVSLTHHEFFTLLYLAQHPSWVLSKEQIYEAVWKADPEQCGAAVANVVYSLRRKIGDGYIETVVGSGYRFVGVGE